MCGRTIQYAFASVALSVVASTCAADTLAESRFDAGADGWSVISHTGSPSFCAGPLTTFTTISQALWQSGAGNPFGHLRHTENNAGTSYFRAPAKFLGNRVAAFGGSLAFDVRTVKGADVDFFDSRDDVIIQGAGVALIADVPEPRLDSWSHVEVPLVPAAFRVNSCDGPFATEAQLQGVLSDLTGIFIKAERVIGIETQDLDNVQLSSSCLATWAVADDQGPSPRWRHAIAIDTHRNILVLFGGDTGETDTWEFSLVSGVWTRKDTAIAPSRRGGHAMVYDASRRRIVLTGGGYRFPFTYAAVDYNDVWEYDTASSTWMPAGFLPDARSGHAMAYDSDRNTIVLYGGRDAGAANAVAVLERSPSSNSWAIRNASGGPTAQEGNTMAYDEQRKRTVILAGAPAGSTVVSVSEWDGSAGVWASVPASPSTPSSRGNGAAVYDPVSQRVIFAGGNGSNETWAFDGSSWTKLANILGGGRTEQAMAYDPLNKRCLLSGGLLGPNSPQRDLLAFNPATNAWTSVWSRFSPSPRDFTAAAYDEVGQKTFLFGGHLIPRSTDNQYGSGTFVFDGSTWTAPTLVGNPGVRWQHTLSFDSQRRKFLLFGGRKGSQFSSATNETWVLDPVALGWSLLSPATLPPARYAQSAVFDRVRGQLIVFGGRDVTGSVLGDTWLLDPQTSTWAALPSADPAPSARSGASMVFDESRGVAVLFGGQVGTGELANDLWEFDGTQWRSVVVSGFAPVARQWAAMVYHPVRKSVVLFGGVPSGAGAFALDDAWEYDGIRWRPVPQGLTRPIGRFAPAVAFDRARNQVVVFGGDSALNIVYANGQTTLGTLPDTGCGIPVCRSDLNADQIVDDSDFSLFAFAYDIVVCGDPEMPVGCPADINEDGAVDDSDFSEFVYAYDLVVCP